MSALTVGELRIAITSLPDEMPVSVDLEWSGKHTFPTDHGVRVVWLVGDEEVDVEESDTLNVIPTLAIS